MAVTLTCEYGTCTVSKTGTTNAEAIEMLKLHHIQVHADDGTKQKAPKVDRPNISKGMSGEEWATVEKKWAMFKKSTKIGTEEIAVFRLPTVNR